MENETVTVSGEGQPSGLKKWLNTGCYIATGAAMILLLMLTLFCYAKPAYYDMFGNKVYGDNVSIFDAAFAKDWSYLKVFQNLIKDPETAIGGIMDSGIGSVLKLMATIYGLILVAIVLIGMLITVIKTIIDASKKNFEKLPVDCNWMMVFCFMPCTYSILFGHYATLNGGEFTVGKGIIAGLIIALVVQIVTIVIRTVFNLKQINSEVGLFNYIQPAIRFIGLFALFIIAICSPIKETMAIIWYNFFSETGLIALISEQKALIFLIEYFVLGVLLISLFTLITNSTSIFKYYATVENAKNDKVKKKLSRRVSPIAWMILSVVGIVLAVIVDKSEYSIIAYDYNYIVPFIVALIIAVITLAALIALNKLSAKKATKPVVQHGEEIPLNQEPPTNVDNQDNN